MPRRVLLCWIRWFSSLCVVLLFKGNIASPNHLNAAEKNDPKLKQKQPIESQTKDLPPHAINRFGTTAFRHLRNVESLVFATNGKSLISSSYDGSILVWDPVTGKQLDQLKKVGGGAVS